MNKFLIKYPLISEKATALTEQGKYTFVVDSRATVSEISKLVEGLYKVHVVKTNSIQARSKPKRYGQHMTLRPGSKKIIVTLKKGEKLDVLSS